jgi:hypothetical protein
MLKDIPVAEKVFSLSGGFGTDLAIPSKYSTRPHKLCQVPKARIQKNFPVFTKFRKFRKIFPQSGGSERVSLCARARFMLAWCQTPYF